MAIHGMELIPHSTLVHDLECIKSLLSTFQTIECSVYGYNSKSPESTHKTFMQLVHDSALFDPIKDHYNLPNTHPVILDRRDAIIQEIDTLTMSGSPNLQRLRELEDEKMEVNQTIHEAQVSLNAAARSLAARIDEFLVLWVKITKLPDSKISAPLKRALDSPTMGYGKIVEIWQAELRRRCLVCPVNC